MPVIQRPSTAASVEGFSQRTSSTRSPLPVRGSMISSQSASASSYNYSKQTSSISRLATPDLNAMGESANLSVRPNRFLSFLNRVHVQAAQHLKLIIRSWYWKVLMVFFSNFVLFGSQLQHLWVKSKHDVYFDVARVIALVIFLTDMVFRCLAEPKYFELRLWSGRRSANNRMVVYGDNNLNSTTCQFGSFMFWCDLISTAIVLYDIGWINRKHYGNVEIDIGLDESGFQEGDFELRDRLHPVSIERNLLVTIARCARVARFVRSRRVVNAINFINWYLLFKHLRWYNPFYIMRWMRKRHWSPIGTRMRGGDESAGFAQNPSRDAKGTWAALQDGLMAAVRAQAEAEEKEAREPKRPGWRVKKGAKRLLGYMGYRDKEREARARLHLAATKIQRAWRTHYRFGPAMSTDGGSLAGDASQDEVASPFVNRRQSSDPNQGKRDALKQFAQVNAQTRGKLDKDVIKASNTTESGNEAAQGSRFQSQTGKGRESQVGSDMREATGQRVAFGIVLALVFSIVFTYTEASTTQQTAMIVLHDQTMNDEFRMAALYSARNTSTPTLYKYEPFEGDSIPLGREGSELKEREKLRISVTDNSGKRSVGWFTFRDERVSEAVTELVATVFIFIVWFFGVTAFTGPVMSLVVTPIERMVRLLEMLSMDPPGYQATEKFKNFLLEEENLTKNTRWTKEILKGMETSFLMSTILRIGSLMKVGFGSAGVEIIRNNLEKGQSKSMLILNSKGSTVSCIFLFCDIRQFTDATECLQEEVFVFTNKIAAVVHSICHSYGGAANKNVGDAFLLSWSLEDKSKDADSSGGSSTPSRLGGDNALKAKNNQADKALLSVIRICTSLHHDKYYLEPLSDTARTRLQEKLKKRPGPVVQMGFGLHAGKAVQGAIGSQRKIDATYVSEAVERAEFLESSTKKYGLMMLMSGAFHYLLHPNTRRRCRKVDQILLQDNEEDADEDDEELSGEHMELFTFDIDVPAMFRPQTKPKSADVDSMSDSGSFNGELSGRKIKKGRAHGSHRQVRNRRRSMTLPSQRGLGGSEEFVSSGHFGSVDGAAMSISGTSTGSVHSEENLNTSELPELVLPTGPALYSHSVWQSPDMKRIRDKYVQGLFSQKYQAGLQAFYKKDWELARQCFQTVLDNFDDGPSQYFMNQIFRNDGVPPRDFLEYGLA